MLFLFFKKTKQKTKLPLAENILKVLEIKFSDQGLKFTFAAVKQKCIEGVPVSLILKLFTQGSVNNASQVSRGHSSKTLKHIVQHKPAEAPLELTGCWAQREQLLVGRFASGTEPSH